jgi:hypothetical protein
MGHRYFGRLFRALHTANASGNINLELSRMRSWRMISLLKEIRDGGV